jgi:hypothetical protein
VDILLMTNQKNSLPWQLDQLKQRFDEWIELQTIKLDNNLPEVDLFSWLNNYWVETIARFLFWIIIAFILGWLGFKTANFLEKYFQSLENKYNPTNIQQQNQQKSILSVHKWLTRSYNFQQQGNYRQAIWCLYMAMLQKLNDQGIAPHQGSRTDGEYLKIMGTLPNFSAYQTLFINHQNLLFANQEATLNMWKECQQAWEQIDFS